jgi:tetratricopeptide (TPR) repeat protein
VDRAAPTPETTPSLDGAPPGDGNTDLSEEIEELRFFLQQGLADEARDSLDNLMKVHPGHPELLAIESELAAAAQPEPEASPAASEALAAAEIEPEPEMLESIDLAAELATEVGDALGDDFQVSFTDVFDEFKKGVAEQVADTDYDTHYDLGIAYKEMGLLEDAVREFNLALHSTTHAIGALTLIGICQLEKGNTEAALDSFLRGLNADNVTPEEAMALRFEIGLAFESLGKFHEAAKFYEKVHAMDQRFRDVATRLAESRRQSADQGTAAGEELDALLDETQAEKRARQERAGKISYL